MKRLEVIKKELERKKYAEMVQDIDPTRAEYVYMSSYKVKFCRALTLHEVASRGEREERYSQEAAVFLSRCCRTSLV